MSTSRIRRARPGALLPSLVASLFLAASLAPSPATAYVSLKYNGSERHWGTNSIRYYIQSSGSDDVTMAELESAIGAAFQSWEDVTCSRVSFVYGGRRSSDPGDGVFVRFQESNWDPTVGDAAAYATPTSISWSGEVQSSEVVFNGQDVVWTTNASQAGTGYKSDIQGVASHEIGHVIGLDHTRYLDATMFFSSAGGAEMRSLEDDDQRGACYLYPSGSFGQGQVCDSCTSDGHCASGACIKYYQEPDYFCGEDCSTSSDCPEGYWCYTDGGLNQCVPYNGYCNDDGGNGQMGDFCYGYSVCESGLQCLPTGSDAYCSRTCSTDDCPAEYECLSGYCIRGGAGALGESCESNMDCASFVCATLRPGTYVCAQDCATDGDCPTGFGCTWDVCFARGDLPFGETCGDHTECQSAYCAGWSSAKYCSQECAGDEDCPTGSYCTTNDYCSKISIETGDECTSTDQCPDSDVCWKQSEDAAHGTCVKECNPFTGYTCPSGMVCGWVEMPWEDVITGGCRAKNGGPQEGDSCNVGTNPCEWTAVCASFGDGLPQCWPHCRTDTGVGCTGGERCIWLNETGNPRHGFCYSEPEPPPPADEGRDVAQPPPDTGTHLPPPDTGVTPPAPDTGGTPPAPDTGWTPAPDNGAPPTPTPDGGAIAMGDTGTAGQPNGGGATGTGGAAGGGCSAGPSSGPAPLLPLLALLLGAALLRRRPSAPARIR